VTLENLTRGKERIQRSGEACIHGHLYEYFDDFVARVGRIWGHERVVFQRLYALAALDPGGIEPLEVDPAAFRTALSQQNHTLKRALTDPRIISGIGNAYSDEILHAAKLSPIAQTQKLKDAEWERLYRSTRETLQHWIDRFCSEATAEFPEKVTAFREGMAAHGRYGEPCPVCGEKILRIRYADNETNYCARCQTGGKVLADRGLSRLLKQDWPRSIDEVT